MLSCSTAMLGTVETMPIVPTAGAEFSGAFRFLPLVTLGSAIGSTERPVVGTLDLVEGATFRFFTAAFCTYTHR